MAQRKTDEEYMLRQSIYLSLIDYTDSNGYTIPCKVREQIENRIVESFFEKLNSSNSPERSVAENAEQGSKADNQKDIEVYVPVEIKEGDESTLPNDDGYYIVKSTAGLTREWYHKKDKYFGTNSNYKVLATHWLKKVTLSSLLTDNEK